MAEYALEPNQLPVLTAYFSVQAKGILGKGGLFVAPPLEECLTGLMGSSTQLEHVVLIYSFSVVVWRTARH